MAVDIVRLLRSYCHVCLMLSFSHAVGALVSRDVDNAFPVSASRSYDDGDDVTVLRVTAAIDDVTKTAVDDAASRALRRRRSAASAADAVRDDGGRGPEVAAAWSRERAARTLRELEQALNDARVNCSRSSAAATAVQRLNAELPVGAVDRFSAEAASVVHAANVVSLLLQSPAAEATSRGDGDAFYFSFARAIVESGSDWLNGATLVVERPGRATIGPRAERLTPKSAVPDLFRVRVTDVGHADWYGALLLRRRGGGGDGGGGAAWRKAGRCGEDSWSTRDGDMVNRSTVVSQLTDVEWSVPYVRCPSLALVSLTVPIYSCGQQHDVIIRSATRYTSVSSYRCFKVVLSEPLNRNFLKTRFSQRLKIKETL